MKTLSLRIAEPLAHELARSAERRGVSKAALVRRVLDEFLSRERPPAQGSFLAMAEDLAGCIDAPPDLSTNDEHLAGYGR